MHRNVVTKMSPDRNGPNRPNLNRNGSDRIGQTESARPKSPVPILVNHKALVKVQWDLLVCQMSAPWTPMLLISKYTYDPWNMRFCNISSICPLLIGIYSLHSKAICTDYSQNEIFVQWYEPLQVNVWQGWRPFPKEIIAIVFEEFCLLFALSIILFTSKIIDYFINQKRLLAVFFFL